MKYQEKKDFKIELKILRDYTYTQGKKKTTKHNLPSKILCYPQDIKFVEELINTRFKVDSNRCIITFYGDTNSYLVRGNFKKLRELSEYHIEQEQHVEVKGFIRYDRKYKSS